jgi:hypothetical protein
MCGTVIGRASNHDFGEEENTGMATLFGMAGLAEAGEAFALMIGHAALVLLGLVAAVGLFARSRVVSGIALALAFFLTFLFMPWEAFRPIKSSDPDVHHWIAVWRDFAWWWGFTVAASVLACVPAFCLPRKAAMQQSEQPTEQLNGPGSQ